MKQHPKYKITTEGKMKLTQSIKSINLKEIGLEGKKKNSLQNTAGICLKLKLRWGTAVIVRGNRGIGFRRAFL